MAIEAMGATGTAIAAVGTAGAATEPFRPQAIVLPGAPAAAVQQATGQPADSTTIPSKAAEAQITRQSAPLPPASTAPVGGVLSHRLQQALTTRRGIQFSLPIRFGGPAWLASVSAQIAPSSGGMVDLLM